jgi:hypothetical protein
MVPPHGIELSTNDDVHSLQLLVAGRPQLTKQQRDQRGVSLTGRGNWGLLRAWVKTHCRVLPNRVPTSLSVSQILSVIFS